MPIPHIRPFFPSSPARRLHRRDISEHGLIGLNSLLTVMEISVRPPIYDPDVQLVYVHVPDLFQSLLLTVSGTSSHLHIWDPIQEKFTLRGMQGRKDGQIVIVGKDEVISARSGLQPLLLLASLTITMASLLKRFLTIGNLMRRLELAIDIRGSRCVAMALCTPVLC